MPALRRGWRLAGHRGADGLGCRLADRREKVVQGAFSKKQTQSHRTVSIGAQLGIHGSGPFTEVLSQNCGDEGHQSREESRAEQLQTRARGRGAQRRGEKEPKRKKKHTHTHTAERPRNHATTQPHKKHNQPTTQPPNHPTTQPHNHTTTQTPTEATGKVRRGGGEEDASAQIREDAPREGQGRGGCKWGQAGRGTAPIQRRILSRQKKKKIALVGAQPGATALARPRGAGNPPRVARGGGL